MEEGGPLRSVRRYVQRQALTAGVVKRAEAWRWGSLWARREGPPELRELLSPEAPRLMGGWLDWINQPITRKELDRLQLSARRGMPYGSGRWISRMAGELGLQHTIREEGRPRKDEVQGRRRI